MLGEVAPITNQRRSALLQEDKEKIGSNRYNFAFAGEYGRVYKAFELRPDSGRIRRPADRAKGIRAELSDLPAHAPTRRMYRPDEHVGARRGCSRRAS